MVPQVNSFNLSKICFTGWKWHLTNFKCTTTSFGTQNQTGGTTHSKTMVAHNTEKVLWVNPSSTELVCCVKFIYLYYKTECTDFIHNRSKKTSNV